MAEVIQADRELFKAIGAGEGWFTPGQDLDVDAGSWDADPTLQAIAGHRANYAKPLIDALSKIRGFSDANGMTRIRMRNIAKAALQPLSQAGEGA